MIMNDNFERVRINEFSAQLFPKQRTDEIGLSAFFMFYKRFLHFTGFTSRREYWWTIAMTALLWVALVFASTTVFAAMGIFGYFLVALFSIILSLGSLAFLFRRYADAGVNRWFAFVASVAFALSDLMFGMVPTLIIGLIAFVIIPALPTGKLVKGVVTVYSADAE